MKEDIFRLAFEQSPFSNAIVGTDGKFRVVNTALCEMTGYSRLYLLNMNITDLIHPEDNHSFFNGDDFLPPLKNQYLQYEKRHIRKDGETLWLLISMRLLTGSDDLPLGYLVKFEEITWKKSAEKALTESEARYEMLFENASDAIFIHDLHGKILEVNRVACERLGYTRTELLGMNFQQLHLSGEKTAVPDKSHHSPPWGHNLYETGQIRKDGSQMTIEASNRIINFDGNRAIMTIARDITYRKQLEEQLIQSQKMEAVGRLAGGVAHDFNNLMTAVISFAEFLLLSIEEGNPMRQDVLEIEKAGKRAAALTRQLLAFSRKQVLNIDIFDLNEIIRNNAKILRRLMGERVKVHLSLNADLWEIESDPSQIELVIMNLALNAKDAMPRGGKFEIRTENVIIEKNHVPKSLLVKPGNYVRLSVSDNGIGMDQKTLSRIFEPFFTTKETDKGTGLGLSTAYGIIKQSHGHVWVYSEPGRGSSFKIYFPRAEGKDHPLKQSPKTSESCRGNETVLVVEDESSIRKLALQILERYGYKCLVAKSGDMAIDICKNESEKIDLMLTDVVMPGITGKNLVDHIKKLRPNIKVLHMSGYPFEDILPYGLTDWERIFISKPFTGISLASKVREVLDSDILEVPPSSAI